MFALRRAAFVRPVSRSLHSSSSVARKAQPIAEVEDDFDLGDDMFGDVGTSSSGSSARSARRSELVENILAKKVGRVGELRKVVALSETKEDLEGLEQVLRAWRLSGSRVTNQTAQDLVGRCINLGHPELAKKYLSDRLNFGLPDVKPEIEAKLQKSLAEYEASKPAPAEAEEVAA